MNVEHHFLGNSVGVFVYGFDLRKCLLLVLGLLAGVEISSKFIFSTILISSFLSQQPLE